MCLIYILISNATWNKYLIRRAFVPRNKKTRSKPCPKTIFCLNTWFYLQVYQKEKHSKKHCLVSCSLKNLKLLPDVDSFMGVVFHGWIVSTITETNYIFRMQQLVSFLHSVQYFISKDTLHFTADLLSMLLSMFEVLCKIIKENTRIFNNCLTWHFNLSIYESTEELNLLEPKIWPSSSSYAILAFQLCKRLCLNNNTGS